jgi:hypothetical protein
MKKGILLLLLFTSSLIAFSQKEISIDNAFKFSSSTKYGVETFTDTVNIKISIKDTSFSYSTNPKSNPTVFSIAKKTTQYIVGKNSEGNYSYLDLKSNQLIVIDYFMSRYLVMVYGKKHTETKTLNIKIHDLLKAGTSQKDVISYLIEQTSKDF